MRGRCIQAGYSGGSALTASNSVSSDGELAAALKQAGFPRIGGRGGGTKDWARYFEENPARQDEALEILRRVTKDFDKRNNTKISGYLDGALAKSKPSTSPPSD
jgi:hypothetical protein